MIASNSNYPPGLSDSTPWAPWNEHENGERDVEVLISSSLSKEAVISTTDYELEEWDDYEQDEVDGTVHHYGGTDYHFDNCDFKKEYNNQHLTPLELIHEFSAFLTKYMPDPIVNIREYKKFQHLLKECEGWNEDETEVIKD